MGNETRPLKSLGWLDVNLLCTSGEILHLILTRNGGGGEVCRQRDVWNVSHKHLTHENCATNHGLGNYRMDAKLLFPLMSLMIPMIYVLFTIYMYNLSFTYLQRRPL